MVSCSGEVQISINIDITFCLTGDWLMTIKVVYRDMLEMWSHCIYTTRLKAVISRSAWMKSSPEIEFVTGIKYDEYVNINL